MPIMLTPQQRAQALYQALVTVTKDRIELTDEEIKRGEIADYETIAVKLDELLDQMLIFADTGIWPPPT